MPRASTAKTLFALLLVSAVFTGLISPVSAASINYSSSTDWNTGNFDNTRTSAEDLILGYDSGNADDVDASQYSSVSGDTSYGEYLTGVEINGISFSSGDNGGYLDVTNQTSKEFKPGGSYPITVDFHIGFDTTDYISVAFDWNGNKDLSDDQVYSIGSCSTETCSVSDTIEVPEEASLNSSVAMRVIGSSTSDPDPTSEGDTRWGEVEDYSAFIPGYTDSGSYSTGWINTNRLASWHNLSYEANISSDTDGQLEVAVSEDGSKAQNTKTFNLEDGSNTLNITDLQSAPYIRVRPTLSTINVEKTPTLEGLEINHKLINITSKGLTNYSDRHRFNISAVAEHPNGSSSFSSCNVYITDNSDFGSFQELGGQVISGEDPVLNNSYNGENKSSCKATISQDLSGINLGEDLDYYFEFKDRDGVKRVTEELNTKLPNRRPEINSTSFDLSQDSHSFNFSAIGYDIDEGNSEIQSCTIRAEDSDGNSFSGGDLDRSGGNTDQAFCNATISSSDGFDPGEPLDIWAEFTDIGGKTGVSEKIQGEVPNQRPSIESIDTYPHEAGHSFRLDAVFSDADTEKDLTNGKCRVYFTDGETSVTVGDSSTSIENQASGDNKASCSYTVDDSLSENFSVGEEIEAKVEFTDEWGKATNSSAVLQEIPNNEPDIPEGLSLDVIDSGSVLDNEFNMSFTNPGDPDNDDITVKAYVGSSQDPSFVENSVSLTSNEAGQSSKLLIGNSTRLSDGQNYFIELEACDEYGLCNSTRANTSFVMNSEPDITYAGSSKDPLTLSDGDITSISANLTDRQSQVEWAYFEVRNVTAGEEVLTDNISSSEQSGDYWNSSSFEVTNNTNYEWSLEASDGFETSSTSGSFGTGETPPIIEDFSLADVEGEHSFTVKANVSDSDGADTLEEATLNVTDGDGNYFTKNPGIVNISGTDASLNETVLNSSIEGFSVGENLNVKLTLRTKNGTTMTDSKTKKIPNRPPEITGVQIIPNNPETDHIIEASYTVTDPEGDEVPEGSRSYQWFIDEEFIPITGKTVSTASTTEGQTWNVSVQLQDEYGATSDTVFAGQKETILNSLPEISREIKTEDLGDHRFKASAAAKDINGQGDFTGCTATIEQGQESTAISPSQDSSYGSTQELLCSFEAGPSTASWIEPTEKINVTFSFSDEENDVTTEEKITVPNERPSVDILSPINQNFSSSSVTFDWEMADQDDNSLSATIKVFDENGVAWESSEIPSNSETKTLDDSRYTYNVTVTDSYDSNSLSTTTSSNGDFIVDTTAPALEDIGATSDNEAYTRVEQNDSLKIYSKWNDNFELGEAKIYENLTDSNHTVSEQEFSDGWANITVPASEVKAGTVSYMVYAYDHLGNLKKKEKTAAIEDIEKPVITEASFDPKLNYQPGFDPGKTVNVEASIKDNLKISNAELRYRKNTSNTWNSTSLSENSGTYSGSFTPSEQGFYHFSVYGEDSYGNSVTKNYTQAVEVDFTWTSIDSIESSSSFTENSIDYGPFKIENTGDRKLNFNSSIVGDKNLSITNNLSSNFSIDPGEKVWADFNASTSLENKSSATLDFSIVLNSSGGEELGEPVSKEITGKAIFADGALIEISTSSGNEVDQGSTGRYSFDLTNKGQAAMNSSSIDYSLPSDWSLNPSVSDQTVGSIEPGESTSISLSADVSADAATGEQTIGVTVINSNDSFDGEFTVTVNEVEEENDTTIIQEPSGGGGGGGPSIPSGGGGERIPEGTSDKILQSNSSFELVRGQDQNFTINFTNPTDYNLSNITVEASGFRTQYLDLKTQEIESLNVNESRPIDVGITAPDFFASQSFDLDFTISGKGYDSEAFADPYFNFTLNKVVSLEIKEISRGRAQNLTERMESLRDKMESEGLPARDVEELLSESEGSIDEGRYGEVRQKFETVQAMYSTGSETKEELQTLKDQIKTAQAQGLSVSQSRRMMNLAEAALDRGAYETASTRLDEAQNLYQLETKGQVNYIYLITSNWMKILSGITVAWILGLLGYYRYRLYRINSRLEGLEDKEENIREMKIQDQKKAFEEQSMSLDAYEDAVDSYNEELINLIEERTELQSKKANITNLKREESLRQERDKLKEIITEAKEDYVKGNIEDSAMYETKVEELTEKLSTVESELAEIEAKSKKKNSKFNLNPGEWKEKLKALF